MEEFKQQFSSDNQRQLRVKAAEEDSQVVLYSSIQLWQLKHYWDKEKRDQSEKSKGASNTDHSDVNTSNDFSIIDMEEDDDEFEIIDDEFNNDGILLKK